MRLILVRHGQSEWNLSNRFTGWEDVDLSENGVKEAREAGKRLKEEGYNIDIAFTSILKRAIKTCHLLLEEMEQLGVPEYKHWRLNERHYGSLQGLNKSETAKEFGDEQVHVWRRSFDIQPPAMNDDEMKVFYDDFKYRFIYPDLLPSTESLKDTLARVLPYYFDNIVPQLLANKTVLIVAHGNSLRAITKVLEGISDEDIISVEIPTGVPIVYDLGTEFKVLNKKTLL